MLYRKTILCKGKGRDRELIIRGRGFYDYQTDLIPEFTISRRLCADAIVNKYYSTISKQLKSLPKNLLASLFLHRRLKALGKI